MYKLLAAAFAAALFSSDAFPLPRAESAQECGIAADMAIVAQSLAGERVPPGKAAAIMARIYDVSESERGRAMMAAILDTAYVRSAVAGASTDTFAEELFTTCIKAAGNMDAVLGRTL